MHKTLLLSVLILCLTMALPLAPAAAETCLGKVANIVGSSGADNLEGGPGDDVIVGKAGNDVINGKGGHDTICGNGGNDNVNGGGGHDDVDGGNGSDYVIGMRGIDLLYGRDGNDNLRDHGFGEWSHLDGGPGFDSCIAQVAASWESCECFAPLTSC